MARTPRLVHVLEARRLTPRMIRVVFGGESLADFGAGEFTDHYVKLHIPAGDDGELRTRTYTVSEWDGERLTIDFVVHGDEGYAGPWAAAAQPGDTLELLGPGGAYTPDPAADWHLMVGDPSVVPAIAASLPRIPAGRPVHVLLQVDGPDDEQPLASPGDLTVRWLHGGGDERLADALRALDFPPGEVHAFVHGEASAVRAVRRHLLAERGIPREAVSVSGYWKRMRTEEGWREDKPEWNRLVEADLAAA
jgi:NADPH-dependent ferric siderophore reductase